MWSELFAASLDPVGVIIVEIRCFARIPARGIERDIISHFPERRRHLLGFIGGSPVNDDNFVGNRLHAPDRVNELVCTVLRQNANRKAGRVFSRSVHVLLIYPAGSGRQSAGYRYRPAQRWGGRLVAIERKMFFRRTRHDVAQVVGRYCIPELPA
jgi:hypothetical protein